MVDIEKKLEICEANSLSQSKEIVNNDHPFGVSKNAEVDDVDSDKTHCSVVSSSRTPDEYVFESASNVSKHGSNHIFQVEARLCEADTRSLGEKMTVPGISRESEKMLVKGASSDTYPVEIGGTTNGSNSSEPLTTISSKDGIDKQDSVTAVFDLNEDISEEGTSEFIQPAVETVSSYTVIKVVAKTGVPRGLPTTPLRFEGGLNWKGSAEMSAFRSVALSNRYTRKQCSKRGDSSRGFTGIDLNIAAVEERSSTLQEHFSSAVCPKLAKILSSDLNSHQDRANRLSLNSYPHQGEKAASKNIHWLGLEHELLGNKTSDHSTNLGKQEIDFIGLASLTDLRTTQQEQAANQTHSKQCLVAAKNVLQPMELLQRVGPGQPKFSCISRALPPQNYFSKVPFSPNHIPYNHHLQEHCNIVQVVNRQSTRNIATSIPTVDARAERSLSTSGVRMGEPTPFMFLMGNPTDEHVKSLNPETWYATTMKRKEPEGGINCYQLGYRQRI